MSWLRYFSAPEHPGAAPPPLWARILSFFVAVLAISLVFYFSFARLTYQMQWDAIWQFRRLFIQGWLVTVKISAVSLVLSSVIGLFFALGQRSRWLVVRYFSKTYIEVIRGTPLLVQILVFFYVVANAIGLDDRYKAGIIILSIFSGAYIAEIFRAGIESVGRSQLESARAIGLTRGQTYRFVVFPQALRQTLPPLAGQFVSLVKDSSLLSIISISEFTFNAQAVNARTFRTLESYLPLALGYLILTLPISLWTRRLEQRHAFDT